MAKEPCFQTQDVTGACDVCKQPTTLMHLPMRPLGFYCEKHCPVCSTLSETTIGIVASREIPSKAARTRPIMASTIRVAKKGGPDGVMEPALPHRMQRGEIDSKDTTIRAKTEAIERSEGEADTANVDPQEQEQQRLVAQKMAPFSAQESKIIEVLLSQGEINRRDVGNLGFSMDLFYSAMAKGHETALVKDRHERHVGGVERYISINTSFEAALKHYFAQQRSK